METQELLDLLDCVRPIGIQRWTARCPAHADTNPSLSIREGAQGILLKCWAGCSFKAICSVMGILQKELFYESIPRRKDNLPKWNQSIRSKFDQRRCIDQLTIYVEALWFRGDQVLIAAQNLDIRNWEEIELDRALAAVARARDDHRLANALENLVVDIKYDRLKKGEEQ